MRALALLKALGESAGGHALFFEVEAAACEANRAILHLNGLGPNGTVVCTEGDAAVIRAFAEERVVIDVIDMDIQGAEVQLVPALLDVLHARVRKLVIGTHGLQGHAELRTLLSNWTIASELPWVGPTHCNGRLRGGEGSRWETQEMLQSSCYVEQTQFGPIMPWDGELVLLNPAVSV
mmetsp:Transcript_33781/g.68455  ORF Transcript_33781/g.68455 Transcript_33781/m.68455 type:complete len:178 (-) Transcript_33781:26-559(-)